LLQRLGREEIIGMSVWGALRIAAQVVAFPIWALELEIETVFTEHGWRNALKRLRLFPNKLATRTIFLVLGGIQAIKLQSSARRCQATQQKVLRRIIGMAKNTVFGKQYSFDKIMSYQDFIQRVPILTYSDHEPFIERQWKGEVDVIVPGKPAYYATTSGTTGKPKYIPVTYETSKHSHRDVSLIWLYFLARRSIGFLDDYLLAVTGQQVEGNAPDGTPFGSASGQLRAGLPKFMQKLYAVPEEVFRIADYDARYYCLALFSLKVQISHISTANPSTLVILFETIQHHHEQLIKDIELGCICLDMNIEPHIRRKISLELEPDPIRALQLRNCLVVAGTMDPAFFWPRLSSIGCWKGGNSPIFLDRLRKIIPDTVPVFDLGYLASEIRATVPIEKNHHGGIPTLHRNFFEFLPVEGEDNEKKEIFLLHELKLGQRYYVLITTDSGLYRYHINDIVRVVGFFGDTPEIVFEQKGEGVTNLTGEKLYEQQVQLAMGATAISIGMPLRFYLCVLNKAQGRYEFLVEPALQVPMDDSLAIKLLDTIDAELGLVNIEYQAKRQSLRLKQPILHILREGAFEAYRSKRIADGVREAQFKMVLLTSKIEVLREFDIIFSKEK
jgi:hypothetical protein